ncbi:serine hydrolase FSH [Aspergillus alliaceus]|uniref:serine hydrolase FSH n=1 Tax=Petromyces alliaceus TaxID=209559 RepID=UPI0012A496A2|nr:serine hydrolase FSH [Aspergillus alliaceus]KAB8234975.1 serine hydrolase FSH [Aspergillus alliaceus]
MALEAILRQTFEQQTAAIRYELGDQHTYDFVEGVVPWESSLKDTMSTDEETFTFCDPDQPHSCRKSAHDLEEYIKEEGPFDGIIGFSMGATMALSWLVNWYRSRNGSGPNGAPFKVAIFFSNAGQPYDHNALDEDRIAYLDFAQVGMVLDLPTAHIWGSADPHKGEAQRAVSFCNADKRSTFVHANGHEISSSAEDTVSISKIINRAIYQVQDK